jgi:hypothetical protein
MRRFLNLFAIGVVWLLATLGWVTLGSVTGTRRESQDVSLKQKVNELWGQPQTQGAPVLSFRREALSPEPAAPGTAATSDAARYESESTKTALASSKLDVQLHSDPRRKGLVWYALYDVVFGGTYSYVHEDDKPGLLRIEFALPDRSAVYDDLIFSVDGQDRSARLDTTPGVLSYELWVQPKQRVTFHAGYKSRGIDTWRYAPADGVARLNAFELALLTDFDAIDFPSQTLAPSSKTRVGGGYRLAWDFRQIVTGQGMGMVMPAHIQPGALASALAFSAPVSLLFFFMVVLVLATLRKIEIHPINYLFLAAAFFAFHLLFAYLVDHISVELAFVLCSAVSMLLVISYMRLVVSSRFAFRETAVAQLVYLIGFSLAHFCDGFTGLTISVLAIGTLFLVMQLTGRLRWNELLPLGKTESPPRAPLAPA